MTPREADAALAAAIGCKVGREENYFWCGCLPQAHNGKAGQEFGNLRPYRSAPTWETSGQLIEGLAAKGYFIETRDGHVEPDENYAYTSFTGPSGLCMETEGFGPKAIAEAACEALGIEVDEAAHTSPEVAHVGDRVSGPAF